MKKYGLVYIMILLLPVIDLITSLIVRFSGIDISLGTIVKSLMFVFSIFYILFLSKSRFKKISIISLVCIFIYSLCYFINKPELLNHNYFFGEIRYLIKYLFFPVITLFFMNYYDESGFDKEKLNKVLFYGLLFYVITIIGTTLFNVNFTSYSNADYAGSVGWFYAANEVSTIVLVLLLFIFTNTNKILNFIIFTLSIIAISLIGTKVTLLGSIILMFIVLVVAIFRKNIKSILYYLVLFIVTLTVMINNYASSNVKVIIDNTVNDSTSNMQEQITTNNKYYDMLLPFLSGRDVYALNTLNIYNNLNNVKYKMFGIGFSNTENINEGNIEKLIESDILDIFFRFGILGLFIFMIPYIILIIYLFKNRNIYKINASIIVLTLIILMCTGISFFAGHVFMAPAVSIYLCIMFNYLYYEIECFKRKEINNNKISILALHMGYGGIENAISNIASMLSEKYEVEIISLYKKSSSIPYTINKKVKIVYLTNLSSNKEAFINALKNKRIIGLFKEGIKSIYILFNKKLWVKNAIINCNSKIIISSRIEFTNLLNRYGNKKSINIHQEHTYSVDEKYIKQFLMMNNIDYIMPVGNNMYNKYKKILGNKVKFIPLSLNPRNKEFISTLDNNNLIAVGRLEPEKGYFDLLKIINNIKKENKNVRLNLFGDGSLKNDLEKIIVELDLRNNVKIWGFQPQDVINKYLKDSSLFLMTSFEESFGLVLVESMSIGVPCIVFDSAKGALNVVNNKNGFIIKNRNIIEYAKTIVDYLKYNNKKKKTLQRHCLNTVQDYEYNNVQEKWLIFVADLIKKDE